jgi:multimeric flavodoxin WrbA
MKITAYNGSPRRDYGNTHRMVAAFLDGAAAAGADVENVFLVERDIRTCTGCYTCWTRTPGRCIQDDDGNELLGKFTASDAVVFATPLYVDNVSGLMKLFIDRLLAVGEPHMEIGPGGECRHPKIRDKPGKIVAIANSGYPEQEQFQVLRLLFRRMARNLHVDLAGEIYRGGGAWLTAGSAEMQPHIEAYLDRVRAAGEELVQQGGLTERTIAGLEAPYCLMQADSEQYIEAVNRMWDARLERLRRRKK